MDARDGDGVDGVDAQAVDDVDGAGDGAAWVDRLRSGSRVYDVHDGDDDDDGRHAFISREEVAALAADGVRIDRRRFRTDLDLFERLRTGDDDDVADDVADDDNAGTTPAP